MFKKYGITVLGILLGGLAGYVYFNSVGCSTGSCLITSNPVNSTLYGAIVGGLLFNTINQK